MKVNLIGIACSSHDVLLAPYLLKAAAGDLADVRVDHHAHILPSEIDARCAAIIREIDNFKPDIVGFSVYCWNKEAVKRISELVSPAIRIVWGGPEIAADDVRHGVYDNAPVDILVVGEGEIPFRHILGGYLDAPRIARKYRNEFTWTRLDDPMIDTLPELYGYPSPYISGGVPAELLGQYGMEAVIETQRGCNFKCAYCQYHQNFPSIRYRSVQDVLDEVEAIYHGGCWRLRFADGNFLSDRKRAAEILHGMAERRMQFDLMFEAIPNFIDDDVAQAIVEYRESPSQCMEPNWVTVGIGLQTMNRNSGKAIKRRIPIAKFDEAYRLLNFAGVTIKTDVILGLPYETKESYLAMIEYVVEKMRTGSNYLTPSVLRILPGSEMGRIAEKCGMTIENGPEHFVYETPTMPRKDMIDCLRITAVANRLFNDATCRNAYYTARNELRTNNVEMLSRIVEYLLYYWRGPTVESWFQPDFPNAEHWWTFDMPKVVTHSVLFEAMGWKK